MQARANVGDAKIHQDWIREENSSLKRVSGLKRIPNLSRAFEHRSNELHPMQERVTELKTRFNDFLAMQRQFETNIAERQSVEHRFPVAVHGR